MAFNFPASPSNGDTYTANGFTYEWDGSKWIRKSPSTGAQGCLLYTSPSPRDVEESRMPSSA